jgi:hypothetical protein
MVTSVWPFAHQQGGGVRGECKYWDVCVCTLLLSSKTEFLQTNGNRHDTTRRQSCVTVHAVGSSITYNVIKTTTIKQQEPFNPGRVYALVYGNGPRPTKHTVHCKSRF